MVFLELRGTFVSISNSLKSFDGPLDLQQFNFHCFLFISLFLDSYCICQYVINQVPSPFFPLSWEAHISEVIGKVAKVLAALRRLRPICPQSTLVTIYKSLILPHLDYCSAVWGCIGNGLSQKLDKLQNRAARIITGSRWDASSAPILHALKVHMNRKLFLVS